MPHFGRAFASQQTRSAVCKLHARTGHQYKTLPSVEHTQAQQGCGVYMRMQEQGHNVWPPPQSQQLAQVASTARPCL